KKLELEVHGCLACLRPLTLDPGPGKGSAVQRFVTTRVPQSISAKQKKGVGLDLAFHPVSLPDAKAAEAWRKKMAGRLKVQFVFRIGAPWASGGRASGEAASTGAEPGGEGAAKPAFEGVTFIPIAHRVIDK